MRGLALGFPLCFSYPFSLEDVALVQNHTAHLQVAMTPSTLTVTRVSVMGTQPRGDGTRGRGANVSVNGSLSVINSAFIDNQQVGLFAFDARLDVTDSLVASTRADPDGRYGNGVQALARGTVLIRRGAVESSAGIGAVFADGLGLLDGVRLAGNTIALHTQDGSTIVEAVTAPATVGPRQVVVTSSTLFEKNLSKTSADLVTVPAP